MSFSLVWRNGVHFWSDALLRTNYPKWIVYFNTAMGFATSIRLLQKNSLFYGFVHSKLIDSNLKFMHWETLFVPVMHLLSKASGKTFMHHPFLTSFLRQSFLFDKYCGRETQVIGLRVEFRESACGRETSTFSPTFINRLMGKLTSTD